MRHLDNEAFDEYVTDCAAIRASELRAKLAAGDAQEISHVDDQIGGLLFKEGSGFTWAQLIEREAQGQSEFQRLMSAAIAAIAECRALKDVEDAEKEREEETAESRYEQRRYFNDHRAMYH